MHANFQQIWNLHNPSTNQWKCSKESNQTSATAVMSLCLKYTSVVPWPFLFGIWIFQPQSICLQNQSLWETQMFSPVCACGIKWCNKMKSLSSFLLFQYLFWEFVFPPSQASRFPPDGSPHVELFSYPPCRTSQAIILKCSRSCFKLKTVQSFSFFFPAVLERLHENFKPPSHHTVNI